MSDTISKIKDLIKNCDGIKLKGLFILIKKIANKKPVLTEVENSEIFNLVNDLCQSVKILYPAVQTLFPEKLNLSQEDQIELFTNIKNDLSTPFKSFLLVKRLGEIIPGDIEVQNHLFNIQNLGLRLAMTKYNDAVISKDETVEKLTKT